MITSSAKFKNHPCFKKHWAGFENTTPITLIIGKNNTGKSHLLQFVEALCASELGKIPWDLQVEFLLSEEALEKAFSKNHSGGCGVLKYDSEGKVELPKRTRKLLVQMLVAERTDNKQHGIWQNGLHVGFHCAVATMGCYPK